MISLAQDIADAGHKLQMKPKLALTDSPVSFTFFSHSLNLLWLLTVNMVLFVVASPWFVMPLVQLKTFFANGAWTWKFGGQLTASPYKRGFHYASVQVTKPVNTEAAWLLSVLWFQTLVVDIWWKIQWREQLGEMFCLLWTFYNNVLEACLPGMSWCFVCVFMLAF